MDIVDLLASTGLLVAILSQLLRTNRKLGEVEANMDILAAEVTRIRERTDAAFRQAMVTLERKASAAAAARVQSRIRGLEQRISALEESR